MSTLSAAAKMSPETSPETLSNAAPVLKGLTESARPERMTARVIEVGEVTAGIAVPEHGGVRFYSSARSFDPLDGTLFRSFEQATRAARERTRALGPSSAIRSGARLQAV